MTKPSLLKDDGRKCLKDRNNIYPNLGIQIKSIVPKKTQTKLSLHFCWTWYCFAGLWKKVKFEFYMGKKTCSEIKCTESPRTLFLLITIWTGSNIRISSPHHDRYDSKIILDTQFGLQTIDNWLIVQYKGRREIFEP